MCDFAFSKQYIAMKENKFWLEFRGLCKSYQISIEMWLMVLVSLTMKKILKIDVISVEQTTPINCLSTVDKSFIFTVQCDGKEEKCLTVQYDGKKIKMSVTVIKVYCCISSNDNMEQFSITLRTDFFDNGLKTKCEKDVENIL